jgi:hypothetical protein
MNKAVLDVLVGFGILVAFFPQRKFNFVRSGGQFTKSTGHYLWLVNTVACRVGHQPHDRMLDPDSVAVHVSSDDVAFAICSFDDTSATNCSYL